MDECLVMHSSLNPNFIYIKKQNSVENMENAMEDSVLDVPNYNKNRHLSHKIIYDTTKSQFLRLNCSPITKTMSIFDIKTKQ